MPASREPKKRSLLARLAIALLLVIPLAVLTGWALDIALLRTVLPGFTPMNPMTAICFLVVGLSFLAREALPGRAASALMLRGAGILVGAFGLLMLLKYMGVADLSVDRILFTDALGINRMAVTTAFDFFLLGICLAAYPHLVSLMRLIALSIGAVATYALVAYLYNFAGTYGQTLFNPMALHTAFLFFLSALYLISIQRAGEARMLKLLRSRNLLTPLAALGTFLVTLIIASGFAVTLDSSLKAQAEAAFESETIQLSENVQGSIDLYINPIYGLQGLFSASDSVSEDEWNAYLDALDIPDNYPGISVVSYAQRIGEDDIASLSFLMYPQGARPYYLPVTYSENYTQTSTSLVGFDYASDPVRRSAYEASLEAQEPVATPVVIGAVSRLPIVSVYFPVGFGNDAASRAGLIAISFRLERIFPQLIDQNPLFTEQMAVTVSDATTGEPELLYQKEGENAGGPYVLTRTDTIDVAGRTWTLAYQGNADYARTSVERYAPIGVIVFGFLLGLLFAYLAYRYVESRERAVSAKNTQLRNVVDQMPFGFLIEDENRKVLYANENMLKVFGGSGVTAESVIGKDTRELAGAASGLVKDFAAYGERIEAVVSRHEAVFNEKVLLKDERVIVRDYVPLADHGRQIGGMWTFKDVTEEENVDRMKTEFVSLASHQLRTPLTSIKWYTELLLEESGELSAEQKEYAEEVKEASIRMNNLVGALLDVSRLDMGTFIIEPKPANLIQVMQQAVHEQEPAFVKKSQAFSFTHPDEVPDMPLDTKLLFIIIQNLLSNANKYSPEGATVKLSLTAAPDGSSLIECADTGYGVPKAQQTSIFKKLFRADNIRSLDVEGTGLGLYMIKTIVDAAGCSIAFVSEEGKGSTFTIAIPATGMKAKSGTRTIGE